MIDLLESKGIICARLLTSCKRVDAFSVPHRSRPLVFLNAEKGSAARGRFDAAHELGHLVMHADCSPGNPHHEMMADRFASAFLFPRPTFMQEFPRRLVWPHLLELRKRWRMSLAAMIHRAFDLSLISKATYTRANIFLRTSGVDNSGDNFDIELPSLIRKALQRLQDANIELDEIASELGVRTLDLHELPIGDGETMA